MDSNLRSYRIQTIDNNTYYFKTEHGDEYICYFISFEQYFRKYPGIKDYIFSFDLQLQAPFAKNKGIDKRISFTVVKAINKFISKKINAVVYTCDPSEGKGAARARKFNAWYNGFKRYSNSILHFAYDAEADGIRLFTALLVHRDNKRKDEFIKAYMDFIQDEQ